jgi:hypothetical protein
MSALLKKLSRWLCSHRFSWPHSRVDGQDYQVCLDCGAEYGYDVNKYVARGAWIYIRER